MTSTARAIMVAPMPHFFDPSVVRCNTTEFRCLAVDKVRYVGEPVAAIVAESLADAEAALSAVAVDYDRVRVIAPRLGGGFGHKFNGYHEEPIVAALSRLVGAPVKWVETRAESLLGLNPLSCLPKRIEADSDATEPRKCGSTSPPGRGHGAPSARYASGRAGPARITATIPTKAHAVGSNRTATIAHNSKVSTNTAVTHRVGVPSSARTRAAARDSARSFS